MDLCLIRISCAINLLTYIQHLFIDVNEFPRSHALVGGSSNLYGNFSQIHLAQRPHAAQKASKSWKERQLCSTFRCSLLPAEATYHPAWQLWIRGRLYVPMTEFFDPVDPSARMMCPPRWTIGVYKWNASIEAHNSLILFFPEAHNSLSYFFHHRASHNHLVPLFHKYFLFVSFVL